MICRECHTELVKDANFCHRCGACLNPVTVATCEIKCKVVPEGGLTPRKCYFYARITDSHGTDTSVESREFHIKGELPVCGELEPGYQAGHSAFQQIRNQILRAGWVYIETYGEHYWEERFRQVRRQEPSQLS